MFADYERELAEHEDKATDVQRQIQVQANGEANVHQWIELIKSVFRLKGLTAD